MAVGPLQAEPLLSTDAASGRQLPYSAGIYFRYQAPDGWSAIPEHPVGLSNAERKVFDVTLQPPRYREIPARIAIAYYAQGNPDYPSVERYIRVFSAVSANAAPDSDLRAVMRQIPVSGKTATLFERARNQFVSMHLRIEPDDSPPLDDPRVYERGQEMMARAVLVRERFVVIPGDTGFYVLRYSAAVQDFEEFLPNFERLIATIDLLD